MMFLVVRAEQTCRFTVKFLDRASPHSMRDTVSRGRAVCKNVGRTFLLQRGIAALCARKT